MAHNQSASDANSAAALAKKLSALQKAQQTAAQTVVLPDGRIRYYGPETPASTPGATRGAAMITEFDPKTGQVYQFYASFDHEGKIIRVHPKSLNGQTLNSPHFPPTAKEIKCP